MVWASSFQPTEKKMRLEREYTSRQAKRQGRPKKLYKLAPGGEKEQKNKGNGGRNSGFGLWLECLIDDFSQVW